MQTKKYYIGLACTGHDNAVAIVNSEGRIIFAEAAERHLQNKRAINSPPDDFFRMGRIISQFCDNPSEIVGAKTWSKDSSALALKLKANISNKLKIISDSTPEWKERLTHQLFMADFVDDSIKVAGKNLERFCRLNNINYVEQHFDHHLCHAAAGFFTSEFNEAVSLIIDGAGEGKSLGYFTFKDKKIKELTDLCNKENEINGSLGFFYSLLCKLCGFESWEGEQWKVMGLAPYGKLDKKIYSLMQNYIKAEKFSVKHPKEAQSAFLEMLERKRKDGDSAISVADIAFTGQYYFCEMVNEILNNLYKLNISENLVLGGGCALNSSYAGKILKDTPFKKLYIHSAPADDGNAIGAAYLSYFSDTKNEFIPSFTTPYLGSTIRKSTLNNITNFYDIDKVFNLKEKQTLKVVVNLLLENHIIGWVQGRAEFGPRALGNRSIIANPCNNNVKNDINSRIKFREEFRPFAPSILHEYGHQYFEDYQESPYMERTLVFKKNIISKIPGVVHVDGTGRLQTVKREWNQKYYDLIELFRQRTGIPILLNTSFNVMGKPIIHSAEDAMAVFSTCGMDALVIDNILIVKNSNLAAKINRYLLIKID